MSRHDSFLSGVSRRRFIQTAVAAVTVTAVPSSLSSAEPDARAIIDTNISLGQWPFRHIVPDTAGLVAKLSEQNVKQAWAGSLDALLHKDLSSANARLVEECKQHGKKLLVPIGAINPMLPGWEEDLRRCDEVHHMPGIRLHPNYHGYKLTDTVFERVLELAQQRKLLVQISVIMEEERTIHRLVNVPPTDTTSLLMVLKKFPKVRLQLLNAFRTLHGEQMASLAKAGVCFEIAMLEGVNGAAKLMEEVPLTSVCFGSHAPVFYFESARLKLQESSLAGTQRTALYSENAQKLLNNA